MRKKENSFAKKSEGSINMVLNVPSDIISTKAIPAHQKLNQYSGYLRRGLEVAWKKASACNKKQITESKSKGIATKVVPEESRRKKRWKSQIISVITFRGSAEGERKKDIKNFRPSSRKLHLSSTREKVFPFIVFGFLFRILIFALLLFEGALNGVIGAKCEKQKP